MSSISEGFDELALPRRKSPAGYAEAIYKDEGATLEDLREAVTTIEELAPIARRVLGGAHPLTMAFEIDLRGSRAALRARETSV